MSAEVSAAESTLAGLPAPSLAVRRLYLLALGLALLVIPTLLLDLPLARFFHAVHHQGPGDLHKAVSLFEAFGHGIGTVVIVAAVVVLDRRQRWQCPRLIACTFGAGIVNLVVKVLVGRSRPHMFSDAEFPPAVHQTFGGMMTLSTGDWSAALDRGMQSFPSGHSAMAAGLAVGLSWLYPQGRYFFAALAALTMLQRVESGAHFPSDTLAGAAIGVAMAAVCCDSRLLGPRFDRFRRS